MLTHPKSPMRVLRLLMHLNSGHVNLLRREFQPSKLSPNWTYGARRTHVGLFPQSLNRRAPVFRLVTCDYNITQVGPIINLILWHNMKQEKVNAKLHSKPDRKVGFTP